MGTWVDTDDLHEIRWIRMFSIDDDPEVVVMEVQGRRVATGDVAAMQYVVPRNSLGDIAALLNRSAT
jgi:hypothetical protein